VQRRLLSTGHDDDTSFSPPKPDRIKQCTGFRPGPILPDKGQNIATEPASLATPTVASDAPGTAAGLLALAGSWEGSDLPERIAEVYATRQPVKG
jgi:hypothetical protein